MEASTAITEQGRPRTEETMCIYIQTQLVCNLSIALTSVQKKYKKCNNSSPPLTDIVLKMCLLGRGLHTLIRNVSFLYPTDVGSHNPPSLGAQRPCRHTARCLTLIHPKPTASRYCPIWAFSLPSCPSKF